MASTIFFKVPPLDNKSKANSKLLMFEAKLSNGGTLKKIVEAIKDVVSDVNLDVTNAGISL